MTFDCNRVKLQLPALSVNEGYARMLVAAFAAQLDPTIEEIADLKTAVSEAVTNCIVHAYRGVENREKALIYITASYRRDGLLRVVIRDKGCGIPDIARAREPLFTTDPAGERTGMGFAIMESFTDSLSVKSAPGKGTRVVLTKKLTPPSEP